MSKSFELADNEKLNNENAEYFERAAEKIAEDGLSFHKKMHDKGGKDPKSYHTSEHLETLKRQAEKMVEILNLAPAQRLVAKMAIMWHDTVIEYKKADPDDLLAMIYRYRGAREGDRPKGADGNESKSAQLLEGVMRKANKIAGCEIFTEKQIETAVQAVHVTYPDINLGSDSKGTAFRDYPYYEKIVDQNPDINKLLMELEKQNIVKAPLFFQPHLENPLEQGQAVPREVLTVALLDLGSAGFAEKENFFQNGDDELRELYANLRRPDVMNRLIGGDNDSDRNDREKVSKKFLEWLDSQTGFAMWQAMRFEKILYLLKQQNGINQKEEQELRRLFSHFAENIRATLSRAENLRDAFENKKSVLGEKEAFLFLTQELRCN